MSFPTIHSLVPLLPLYGTSNSTESSTTIDAAGDKIFQVWHAPKAGTIDRVVVLNGAGIGTPPVYEVRLESLTNGLPSGSLIAAGANATFTPGTSRTYQAVALTTPPAVTLGQAFAVVVQYSSGTINASNNSSFLCRSNPTFNRPFYGGTDMSVGTYSLASSLRHYLLPLYDDDEPVGPLAISSTAPTQTNLTSASTPNEVGIRFTCPTDCYVHGLYALTSTLDVGNTITAKLYDIDSNLLASATITRAHRGTGSNRTVSCYFAPVRLRAGYEYRATFVADSSSGNVVSLLKDPSETAAIHEAAYGPSHWTERTSGGAWTDAATTGTYMTPLVYSYLEDKTASKTEALTLDETSQGNIETFLLQALNVTTDLSANLLAQISEALGVSVGNLGNVQILHTEEITLDDGTVANIILLGYLTARVKITPIVGGVLIQPE